MFPQKCFLVYGAFKKVRISIENVRMRKAILVFLHLLFAEKNEPYSGGISLEIFSFFSFEGNKGYLIQLRSSVFPIYCHMTNDLGACGGGGWTLVMKIDGSQVPLII